MIVKMKRLELLLYYKEREQFLDSLRSLGVVHIEELPENSESRVSELAGRSGHVACYLITEKSESERDLCCSVQDGDPVGTEEIRRV